MLGTSICCQLKAFLPSKRKGKFQHSVDDEVSALARLAYYENQLIGQEISLSVVCIKRVDFTENVRAFFPQGQSKLSVKMKCPY